MLNGPEKGPQFAQEMLENKERAELWELTACSVVARGFKEREGKKKPPPDIDVVELLRKAEEGFFTKKHVNAENQLEPKNIEETFKK